MTDQPSKKQVKKAGRTVRRYHRGEVDKDQFDAAVATIWAYRSGFSAPLAKVTSGLRGFMGTLDIDAEVSQRLKRLDTILDKLSRESTLSLDTMGDIGGCRVVLANDSIDELRRVQGWIEHRWGDQIVRVRDYIEQPRQSGYRAVHITVVRDDHRIEIQLRTAKMHEWAQIMERASQLFGENFKQDGITGPIGEFARTLSLRDQASDGLYSMTDSDRDHYVNSLDAFGRMMDNVGYEGGGIDAE